MENNLEAKSVTQASQFFKFMTHATGMGTCTGYQFHKVLKRFTPAY